MSKNGGHDVKMNYYAPSTAASIHLSIYDLWTPMKAMVEQREQGAMVKLELGLGGMRWSKSQSEAMTPKTTVAG